MNIHGITKCKQTVLVSDVHRIRPHEYRHIHKFDVKPPGWNVCNNSEVKEIMEATKLLVEGEEGKEGKILLEHPHST